MTFVPQVRDWLKAHPLALDGVLTAVLLTFAVDPLLGEPTAVERRPDAFAVALFVVSIVPIIWRRTRPLPVLLLVIATAVIYETMEYPDSALNALSALLVIYALAAYAPRHQSIFGAAFSAVALSLIMAANWDDEASFANVVANYVIFGTAWIAGDNIRQRRERVQALEERARLAEQRADEEAARAVTEERTRIARELHDVVAHSVSVMVVQAGAARRMLQRETPDPGRAIEALASVEEVGRESLNELRRLLGVLRKDDDRSFGRAPQPSIRYVDTLVEHARGAGLDVDLVVEGELVELPGGVDLTAYRIVQEALTNAIKHAGPDVHADVRVCYGDREVEVLVADDGRGADAERPGGGHGLVGMAERVSLFGGRLVTGNRPGGGFQVRASLPIEKRVDA